MLPDPVIQLQLFGVGDLPNSFPGFIHNLDDHLVGFEVYLVLGADVVSGVLVHSAFNICFQVVRNDLYGLRGFIPGALVQAFFHIGFQVVRNNFYGLDVRGVRRCCL